MIKHARISNYKSLGDVAVDLDPVTVLIGRSGTGKTTFVEALRFLRDYVAYRGENAVPQYGGWQRVLSATAPRPMAVSFTVKFDAPGVREDYEYTLTFQQHPQQPHLHAPPVLRGEKLALGGRVLFHHDGGQWLHPPDILLYPPQPGGVMLGALTGFPEATRAHLVLSSGLGWYAFSDTVLLPPPQQRPPHATGLADNGANFLHAFTEIIVNLQTWDQQKEMIAALRRLNGSITSLDLQMPNRDSIAVGHKVGDKVLSLDLAQESEGFRRVLAYLVALYQSPAKQVLIFEEPEKGIHPGALEVLAEQFKACPDEGRGQVILTTHSPELLDHFPPEALRVVEIVDYVTRIGPVAQDQVEAIRERLLRPGELVTVDPARLVTSDAP